MAKKIIGGTVSTPMRVDKELNGNSTNPVQNKAVAEAIGNLNALFNECNSDIGQALNRVAALEKRKIPVDTELDATSTNPVQNKAVVGAIQRLDESIRNFTVDDAMSATSTNPVQNKVVQAAISGVGSQASSALDGLKQHGTRLTAVEADVADLKENGGGGIPVDDALSTTSTNPVANKVVAVEIEGIKRDLYDSKDGLQIVADTARQAVRDAATAQEKANTAGGIADYAKSKIDYDVSPRLTTAVEDIAALKESVGDIDTALDSIIDIQQSLIEGDGNITEEEVDGMINAALEVIENGTY